jgi:uncharacterized protein YutE (UPF0331/DUF86 family)
MVFSKQSVLERLKKLEEVLAKLKEKECVELTEYKRDTDTQWLVERGLEIASSMILDIGNHILASVYQTAATEYEEILEKLGEKQVISESLYKELQGLGGFRNILVHGYLSLNLELTYEHYKKALDSFPEFIVEIERWVSMQ